MTREEIQDIARETARDIIRNEMRIFSYISWDNEFVVEVSLGDEVIDSTRIDIPTNNSLEE